jgi:integrase
MARRGAGEGSIYRRKDGRWPGDVQLGVDEHGKRLRQTVYGATQAEVVLGRSRRSAIPGSS